MAPRIPLPSILKTDGRGNPQSTGAIVLVAAAVAALFLAPAWMDALAVAPDSWNLLPSTLSVAAAVALLLRRRVAVELAAWTVLLALLVAGGPNLAWQPAYAGPAIGAAVAWVLVIWAGRHVFLPAPGTGRPLFGALRVTVAMFLVLEVVAGAVAAKRFIVVTKFKEPQFLSAPGHPRVPGLPTLATLGSSPANLERVSDRPFSAMLAERLKGRFNFRYFRQGGVDSGKLVHIARTLSRGDDKVDAFLLYAGFQDFNVSDGAMAIVHDFAPIDRVEGAADAVRLAISHSHLLRLGVYLARQWQAERREGREGAVVDAIFERYRQNMESILQIAADAGIHVFAITLAKDRDHCSAESNRYQDRVNAYVRGLGSTHPHVTVVEFEKPLMEKYPNGRLPSCEPFEPLPGVEGKCGDPYHLDPAGHAILADVLEPVLTSWRPK